MRGITKQEFYRLRSKFRLLKRVYDDQEFPPDIHFLISKLSRYPLHGQLVQLVIAEPAKKTTQTRVERLKADRFKISKEVDLAYNAKVFKESIMKSPFAQFFEPIPIPASLYLSMLAPEGSVTSEEHQAKIRWLKEKEAEGNTNLVTP